MNKRRHLCWILLCFLSAASQPDGDDVFRLQQLPDSGLILDQKWTYYPGDDARYASVWEANGRGLPLNPATLIDQLPEVKNAGIGWFRLKLWVHPSMRNKTIGIMLSLFGAAEIYLNGRQIYRYGTASADYASEHTQSIYARSVSLALNGNEYQLLAVRFSHHKKNLAVRTGIVPFALRITAYPLNKAIDHYALLVKRVYRFFAITLTIELAAALLTLFFFFSFPTRKEYLFYGVYFGLNFFAILVQGLLTGVSKDNYITVNQAGLIQMLVYLFLMTGTLFHVNAAYALLRQPTTRYYRFLSAYAVCSVVLTVVKPEWFGAMPVLFFPLACFELLPVYFKAARRKFRGAWTLFVSVLICFSFLLLLVKVNTTQNMDLISVLTALVLLTPALGVMIFLAGDFARTSAALQERIVEVEALSQKSLAQEREKQAMLAAQKGALEEEVETRTAALRQSLTDLKAAQAKLVQAEKMASLGEVTAGIAHEIQNPLNFVTNFSETTEELMSEMEEALRAGRVEEAGLLADEMRQNLQKIGHHGRRADSIVKGMLQHSRKSTGQKLPVDINALVEEYLRLSYHGCRATDKTFHAALLTRFDERIGKMAVIPQDLGRVLLNLFNNAFYAVLEKKKTAAPDYKPTVQVLTRLDDDKVKIRVKDNGTGIGPKAMRKIFQPFFTTKPAGSGTGLGLSISYDIIKLHGGELKVKSTEGEETEFTIVLYKKDGGEGL